MGQILCLGYLRGPKERIIIESFSLDSLSSGGTSIKFGIIQVTGNAPWIRIDEVDPFMDWQFTSDGIHIKTPKGLVCIDPSKIDEDVPLPSLDEGFFFFDNGWVYTLEHASYSGFFRNIDFGKHELFLKAAT